MLKKLLTKISTKYFRILNIPGKIYNRNILNTHRKFSEAEVFNPSKNHICILFCYNNYEHIVECFNSLYREETDYFIIENYSKNSDKIKDFFLTKKLKGYIQFKENITNNATSVFFMDFYNLLKEYKYVTLSDCDLLVKDKNALFTEIFKNLELEDVLVSCVDLDMKNLPNVPGSELWIPKGIETNDYIEGLTGAWILTIKNENLDFFYNVKSLDSAWHLKAKSLKKKWVKTRVNKAYHLTWDLYNPENEYYKFKEKGRNKLWHHSKVCDYIKIK